MTLFKNKYRIESARLKGWDYRAPGYYFVTIVTKGRVPYFGKVQGDDVRLSAIGEIAAQCWAENPQHHAGIELDEWIIMPNHVHGIVVADVETLHYNVSTSTSDTPMGAISPKTGSLSVAVRSFKSAVTKLAHNAGHEFGWQERFWDRIIRDEKELNRIRNYIRANPSKWENDRNDDGLWI